jgi:ATP-dependent DNA helicase RecG
LGDHLDVNQISDWINSPTENENLEFKEAKETFSTEKALGYFAAIANEGGGHLILGVTDNPPRRICGSNAFQPKEMGALKLLSVSQLSLRIDATELTIETKRLLVFSIPSRPIGIPIKYDGKYLMRVGESTTAMTEEHLKRIFNETRPEWSTRTATEILTASEIISLLDTQGFFQILGEAYPQTQDAVIHRLLRFRAIRTENGGFVITNFGAFALAKKLSEISPELEKFAPRIIHYNGLGKMSEKKSDETWDRGLAISFDELLDRVHSSAPKNRIIEEAVRVEVFMFPKQALRELIANALVHQDLEIAGMQVTIEMFNDRIEISNPGSPIVDPNRFIDENEARNPGLAKGMRSLKICEESGSGIDKVISAAEVHMLPAPSFQGHSRRTTAIMFGHQDFKDMTHEDQIRACYQHCCLCYVTNQQMTNSSLRLRFGLSDSHVTIVSKIIADTREVELIVRTEEGSKSSRNASYLPFWVAMQ